MLLNDLMLKFHKELLNPYLINVSSKTAVHDIMIFKENNLKEI